MEFDVVKISMDDSSPDSFVESCDGRTPVICLAQTDDFIGRNEFEITLSEIERGRAATYRLDRDRDRFVVRRGLLRRLLSVITGSTAADLRIDAAEFRKPFLADFPDVHFSVSHSNGFVVMGFSSQRRIGVDVETRSQSLNFEAMARTVFSAADVAEIVSLDGEARRNAFFRTWTRLEALTKAIGTGLSHCPDVPLNSEGESLIVTIDRTDWHIADLRIDDNFACALALEDRD